MELKTLTGHSERVACISWSSDSTKLVSISHYGEECFVWEVALGKIIKRIECKYEGNAVSWEPNGDRIAFGAGSTLCVWDKNGSVKEYRMNSACKSVQWCPNGRYVATSLEEGNVRIWDADAQKEIIVWQGKGG